MFLGFAGGLILIFLTVYISDISPSTMRGALVSIVFLQIAGGQILYHLLNWISSSTPHETQIWHWLIATILPVIHIIVIIAGWLPESPRWLYRKGYIQQAEESLKMMLSSCEVFKEVTAMKLSLEEEVEVAEVQQENELNILDVILEKVPARRIIVGFGSLVAQQFVGISMIMRYSYAIFHLTTGRYNSKIVDGNVDYIINRVFFSVIPLITSSLVLVGTIICTILVDRFGRRRLLLVSISEIVSSLGLLSWLFCTGSSSVGGIVYRFPNTNLGDEDRDFWYNTDEERASCMGLLALLALAMYIVFHSLGIGTVPWIINSEIYPMKYRNVCLAVANVVYWCSKMVVQDLLFDCLGQYLSAAQMLFLLCLFSGVVGLLIYFYIPDQKVTT
ncbi:hypothetical protein MKW94_004275 [Papaver nudicaule]|uniref:Major facilitator superfamily (MFS) profile domain-containing protein n=1 Tax=Papaver nudicaule TaxID=74823 RepID=A0AA41SA87_PAPNU|nr:hypothetical protein [Papaver nudicaule]